VVPPSQASTYAYVNPLVAVLLGWLLGGESITTQMLVAGAFILPGVILILRSKSRQAPAKVEPGNSPQSMVHSPRATIKA
jgi:drug/metabolite transporter (DMT)-like permease